MNYSNESVCTCCSTWSRYALRKSKIWRLFFCIPTPPPEYQWVNPPPLKHNSIQSLIGLEHYIKSYMSYRTITISVYDCNGEIIFVNDEIHAKIPQKPNFHWEICWPIQEEIVVVSGRVGMYDKHTWQLIVFFFFFFFFFFFKK